MSLKELLQHLAVAKTWDGLSNWEDYQVDYKKKFEAQRRNIGMAFSLGNEIREFSKSGIASLKNGDEAETNHYIEGSIQNWKKLRRLDLPADIGWQHDAEAGQEMGEFVVVSKLYPLLLKDSDDVSIPSAEELDITPQSWLACLGDSVGELGKLLDDYLCREDLKRSERIACRKRFLNKAREIYDFLDQFETCYPMVINNSRRRGYGNTFRGLLGRIRGAIRHQQEALIRFLDDSSTD